MQLMKIHVGPVVLLSVAFGAVWSATIAGDLTPPPGAVGPTFKTIAEVEPRIAISSVNTPGDADSVFKIIQPGSYYLSGDVAGIAGKHGIEIVASNVTVDLMGFSLRGSEGSLGGVRVTQANAENVALRNGIVSGWGLAGVDLAAGLDNVGCIVEHVQSTGNLGVGINASSRAIIRHCSARGNGTMGISTGVRSLIEQSLAEGNAISGISAGFGTMVRACTSTRNEREGISTANACQVIECSVIENNGDGVKVGNQCLVRGNLCDGNGFFQFDGAGIHVPGSDCRIEDNTLTRNDRGLDVDFGGNFIVRNSATGNGVNYDVTGTQTIGPIVTATGTIAGASPWANFSF